MAMKGIFKGLRVVSQIFTAKEREMEIGCPTDVKHVAHIGWGSSSMGNASPSWMNESADLSSFRNFAASTGASWASQDFDLPLRDASLFRAGSDGTGHQQDATPCPDVPRPPRKTTRRRKPKDGSPPRPSSSRDSLSSAPSAAAAPAAAEGAL